MDFRPKTGELYAVTVGGVGNSAHGRLYTLNTATGLATPVGLDFSISLSATAAYDMDFNPTVDRIRLVNTAGLNLRLNLRLSRTVCRRALGGTACRRRSFRLRS